MTKAKIACVINFESSLALTKSELGEHITDLFYIATDKGGARGSLVRKTWGSVDLHCEESTVIKLIPLDLQADLLKAVLDTASRYGYYKTRDLLSNDPIGLNKETQQFYSELFDLVEPFLPFFEMALAMLDLEPEPKSSKGYNADYI